MEKQVNVLIGANNSGKTAVIDALRLSLGYKDQKNIYVSKNDFYINSQKNNENLLPITFDLCFKPNDNSDELAWFYELYNPETDYLELHFKFELKNISGLERVFTTVWGGKNEGNIIPNEILHLFTHVYLNALRDAQRYLRPGKYSKLGQLFSNANPQYLSEDFDKEDMISELKEFLEDSKINKYMEDVNSQYINNHYNEMTFNDSPNNIEINAFSQDFEDIVNNFEIKLPLCDYDSNHFFDLSQNGLGYNNLIYISVLLGDLKDLNKFNQGLYVGLCIEEPESHLQPQLQNLFFSYLNSLNRELNNMNGDNQSFQIFITSHSPTLTAKADLDSIILLQHHKNNVCNLSLKNSELNREDRIYLHKFLDVTKSQLLFSNKIIFVEGISEALLMPIFAKKLNMNLDKEGVEIVNIGGLGFKHFMPLFSEDSNLSFKASVITDKDNELNLEPSDTYKNLKNLGNKNCEVFGADVTLEYELLINNKDNDLVLEIFKSVHSRKIPNFLEGNVDTFEEKFFKIAKCKYLKKSDIAMKLAIKLSDENNLKIFKLPSYIENALNFINE